MGEVMHTKRCFIVCCIKSPLKLKCVEKQVMISELWSQWVGWRYFLCFTFQFLQLILQPLLSLRALVEIPIREIRNLRRTTRDHWQCGTNIFESVLCPEPSINHQGNCSKQDLFCNPRMVPQNKTTNPRC